MSLTLTAPHFSIQLLRGKLNPQQIIVSIMFILQTWMNASHGPVWTEESVSIRSPTSPAFVPLASLEHSVRQVTGFVPVKHTGEIDVDRKCQHLVKSSFCRSVWPPVMQHFPTATNTTHNISPLRVQNNVVSNFNWESISTFLLVYL